MISKKMAHFKKEDVRKAILKQIEKLCSENKITYIGQTEITLACSTFRFTEVKDSTILLEKELYTIGETIHFEEHGIFVFIECDESLPFQNRNRYDSSDFIIKGSALVQDYDEKKCSVCINNNSLSIIKRK